MAYGFPPELQQLVHQELASGSYSSEDELLLEAVRLLHQREEDFRNFKVQLQGRLDRLDRGEGIELENEAALRAFFDDVQARGQQRYGASRTAP
jgi:Arc/MetJ-type ribon-helix-helix transcriptional regulator